MKSRLLRDILVVAAVALIAGGAAALWTAPAPLFSSDHAVPRVLEMDLRTAQDRLTALGYRVKLGGSREHPSVPRGRVIGQDPPAGVILARGSAVELVTSGGRPPVIVPDVVGFAATQALQVLAAAGLTGVQVDSVSEGVDAPGIIVSTRPRAGTAQDAGSSVGLVVSTGTGGKP